ncbi:MAG: glycogen synthase GlgA [Roseinatronobacter sp.]
MAGGARVKVLSVTSEAVPLVKTGGLADVAGALPAALAPQGVQMRTLLPGYRAVMAVCGDAPVLATLPDCLGGAARVLAVQVAGLDLLVLDAPHRYDRGAGPYLDMTGRDWPDNAERFAALSWVAAKIAGGLLPDWAPDLIHAHDWQAGLAPYYLARSDAGRRVASVLTIHNIAFQGLAPYSKLSALRLPAQDFHPEALEYWGQISTLKAGLVFADRLTTVSPTYAEELLTPEFGMGMEGVLNARRAHLSGILNGIDRGAWSPDTDPHVTPYSAPAGKGPNKAALRAEFGLPEATGPLCIVVSRLTEQKGLDLLLDALPALLAHGGQLAVLGTGDPALEAAFKRASAHPHVAVRIGYDEALSHRMMAGADAILVPSRFEPCGLTQLYGLRYGTLPVVALTGGLADTVIPATPATLAARVVATGFQFHPVTAQALAGALTRLCHVYQNPAIWSQMSRNAMAHPVGWDHSAADYAALYRDAIGSKA